MAKTKTEVIKHLAVEAGLPETIRVTFHRGSKCWYIEYPLPLGTDAVLGHRYTLVAKYIRVEDARAQIAGDVAAFNALYQRVIEVVGGAIDRLSDTERKLIIDAHRIGGLSTTNQSEYQQLVTEGVVKTVPQIGSKERLYILTSLGQRIAALIEQASH